MTTFVDHVTFRYLYIKTHDCPHVAGRKQLHEEQSFWTISYMLQPMKQHHAINIFKRMWIWRAVCSQSVWRMSHHVSSAPLRWDGSSISPSGVTWHRSHYKRPLTLSPSSKWGDAISQCRKRTWRRVTFWEYGSGRTQHPADDTTTRPTSV